MREKDRCAVFGCNNDRLFPRNIHWSSLFARKARGNTERVLPGHPIILLKSNKFNMASVSVTRSIQGVWGDFVSRVAGLWYLSETSHLPPPTERVNFPPWPHPICYRTPPPPHHLPQATPTNIRLLENSQVSQVAGCRCTLLARNSSISVAGSAGTDKFYYWRGPGLPLF